jgi:hypothetical protein
MMVRNLKSPLRRQPDHFEIAMISDANDLFRVVVDLDGGHVGFQRFEKIDPEEFSSNVNGSIFLPGAG